MKTTIQAVMLGILMTSSPVFAGHGKEGGDPMRGRKEMLAKSFVNLKADIKSLLPSIYKEINDAGIKQLLSKVSYQVLKDDIDQSSYVLSEKCQDEVGDKHAASTENGIIGAQICFDLSELTLQQTTNGELIGLAIHEHLHHFGVTDSPAMYLLISEIANIKMKSDLVALKSLPSDKLDGNRRAHKTVWTTLFKMEEISRNFDESGSLKVSSIKSVAQSQVMPQGYMLLTIVADMVDKVLVEGRGAKRNYNKSYQSAITDLLIRGVNEDRNLKWLADELDHLYTFWQE
jgi:hypothetical protein